MSMLAPIALLVAGDGHADFGAYTAEILRLVGLTADTIPLEALAGADLPDRVVCAPDLPLLDEEIARLHAIAQRGGRLVFLAPHPFVAERFGFTPTYRTTVGGRLKSRRLPFHSQLRHLVPPDGAEVWQETTEGEPAVVRVAVGEGDAVFVLYDLPRSVALTRQGDPNRRGLHGNRVAPGWRAADQFADFLDLADAETPAADLLCGQLRDLLVPPLANGPGLPVVGLFPHGAKTVLLLSSDDDWSTPEQFEALRACLRRHGATITWYLVPETIVTPEWKAAQEAAGDTFSIHPVHREPLARTWNATVESHRKAFVARFDAPPGPSVRNHAIPWIGYVEGARRDLQTGFTWDANFFTCPPRTAHYMSGSGLPLPFVDETGAILPVYQLPCQYSDETTLAAGGFDFSLKLTEDEAVAALTARLDANLRESSALCINTHPISFATYSGPFWDRVFAAARARGIPLLALETFAAFWETRGEVRIGRPERTETGWTWTVNVPENAGDLSVVLSETGEIVALPAVAGLLPLHRP